MNRTKKLKRILLRQSVNTNIGMSECQVIINSNNTLIVAFNGSFHSE